MNKFLDRLFRVIQVMIAIFLGLMILLVFLNVLVRNLFNIGFVWSEELSRLCFIFLVYLGSIEAMRYNRHLLIDSLLLRIPKLFQIVIYAFTQLAIIWVMAILTQGAWSLVIQNLKNFWIATHFPAYIVHFFGCILGVSVIIISVANLIRLFVLKTPVVDLIRTPDDGDDVQLE